MPTYSKDQTGRAGTVKMYSMNVPLSPQVRIHDKGAVGDFREEAGLGKGLAE